MNKVIDEEKKKTAAIEQDVHDMVMKKQKDIKDRRGVTLQVSEIINSVLRDNISKYDIFGGDSDDNDIIIAGHIEKRVNAINENVKAYILDGWDVSGNDNEKLEFIINIYDKKTLSLSNGDTGMNVVVIGNNSGLVSVGGWNDKGEGGKMYPVINAKKVIFFGNGNN